MDLLAIREAIRKLARLDYGRLYQADFLLTWDHSLDELRAVLQVADILKGFRQNGLSPRVFDSGLGVTLFRDHSTRTRFSYAKAANLLGLMVQDLDEGKSQIAHGETARETAAMISFMTESIGIRDDMYIGRGHAYMLEAAQALTAALRDGVLDQRPSLVNLQCDLDHPTQSMADLAHLIHYFGGLDHLKGKKLAMSWAYSPSYGKPLSVPQGVVGLMTRLGMDVVLAHPKGYEIMPEVEELARNNAGRSGGAFSVTHDMDEAFDNADVVYPKSWAPFAAMEQRTLLYDQGEADGIKALEKDLLARNADYNAWECTEKRMALTRDGRALYLHCLPADISNVSCVRGEVAASVFDRCRTPLYLQAGYKPYIIAAMIFLARMDRPADMLMELLDRRTPRLG